MDELGPGFAVETVAAQRCVSEGSLAAPPQVSSGLPGATGRGRGWGGSGKGAVSDSCRLLDSVIWERLWGPDQPELPAGWDGAP